MQNVGNHMIEISMQLRIFLRQGIAVSREESPALRRGEDVKEIDVSDEEVKKLFDDWSRTTLDQAEFTL